MKSLPTTNVTYLQAVANILGSAVQRDRIEQNLIDRERQFRQMIDAVPAAIYTTDAKGRVTNFDPTAVELSGRAPELGSDHWCVTWKLFKPNGVRVQREDCPMAVALREDRAIRDVEIIAERPDGERIWCLPYPTPLHDTNGKLVGGINILMDITDRKRAERIKRELDRVTRTGGTVFETHLKRHNQRRFFSSFSATRAFTIFFRRAAGRGLSTGNRIVPFEVG